MKYPNLIFTAVVIGALAGCATTDVHAPRATPLLAAEYGLGDSDRNLPVEPMQRPATDTSTAESGPWWQAFGDERLNRLVERMLAANTELASAGLRLERARLIARLAFDSLLPQLDAGVSGSHRKPLERGTDSTRSYGASIGVSYEVDLWRRLRDQRDIATWETRATAEDFQSTRLALIGATCDLYWQLAFLNQRIVASDASIERLRRTQALVQVQLDAGDVSRLESREAEQNLQSELAARSQLTQARVEVRNALTVLLDGNPWPQSEEPGELILLDVPEIQAGLPAELLSRRPDMRAAELRLREVLVNIGVVRASYYPTVSLTGSIGGSALSLRDVLSDPVATLGAGLALPFLRWNRARLDVAIAENDYALAVNDFRDSLYRAFVEVDTALAEKAALQVQVEATRRSHEEAIEVERLYGVRYRAGATPLRNWLDAQETRRLAEIALAQARLSQLRNLSLLYRALGGNA